MSIYNTLSRRSACGSTACILVLLASSAVAAPTVQSLSGNISHNTTVTITGTGFGTKSVAIPVAWDTFEDGTVNTTATAGNWSSVNYLGVNSSAKRHQYSNYAAYMNMTGNWPNNSDGFLTGGSDNPTWFVQYWVYLGANFNFNTDMNQSRGNVKFFRMWTTGSDSKNFVAAFHNGNHVCALTEQCQDQYPGCYLPSSTYNPSSRLGDGKWHLLQFEFKESGAAGQANGVWRMWHDGQLIFNYTDLITKCSGHTSNSRPYVVGFFDSHSAGGTNSDFYLDDAYIDNTWSRVEIGDNPSYANSTHREIQIPSAWADGLIKFTVNQGSFTSGSTAYLFVVDSTGAVNPNGYPITIGGGGNDTLSPPGNLNISQ